MRKVEKLIKIGMLFGLVVAVLASFGVQKQTASAAVKTAQEIIQNMKSDTDAKAGYDYWYYVEAEDECHYKKEDGRIFIYEINSKEAKAHRAEMMASEAELGYSSTDGTAPAGTWQNDSP